MWEAGRTIIGGKGSSYGFSVWIDRFWACNLWWLNGCYSEGFGLGECDLLLVVGSHWSWVVWGVLWIFLFGFESWVIRWVEK